ncbi:hypothetical protein [Butyricimonas virosa]|uniref:hypothetical protein n=1 Tax=Butyricimonas virosa TaxID=544645 RepID=UPI00242C9791|nr:hypothetical protein [Butyricimonas virosa]MCI7163637.1 hypothetical protein [Butyricimonas virosa]
MRKICDNLDIRRFGLLEVLIALYPILMGYQYGSIPCTLLFLLVMDLLALFRKTNFSLPSKYMKYLAVFVIMHEVILCATMKSLPSYHVNSIVSLLVIIPSIFVIVPVVNFEKLKGAINLIAVICMMGMFYHFIILQTGYYVSPIKVPFMPDMQSGTRLYSEVFRPCSFFWEPQSYCTFMSVPLFYSLIDKKYFWTVLIILSMFLSTSTTGIAISILSLAIFVLTQKVTKSQRVIFFALGISLVYVLFTADFLSAGVEKMASISYEASSRLYNGPTLIANMHMEDFVFGINYSNVYDYYRDGNIQAVLMEKYDSIFMPSFWNVLAKFGVIGLLLYLGVYVESIRRSRMLLVYVLPLIIALFTNPDFLGGLFAFEFIVIYSFIVFENQKI